MKTVSIDTVRVGEIQFKDIVATVGDFSFVNQLKTKSCLNISGILGANIMNKAVWQIDYPRQMMRIASHKDSIRLPDSKKVVSFSLYNGHTPFVKLTSNGVSFGNARFDTGNSGFTELSQNTAKPLFPLKKMLTRYGYTGGAFGIYKDTAFTTALSNLTLGDTFTIKNAVVDISKKLRGEPLIGYEFLKNYVVTIDWAYQEITFSDYQPSRENALSLFGFSYILDNGKLIVASLIEQSEAMKMGLMLNDQILKVNDFDCRALSQEEYCKFRALDILEKSDAVKILVKKENREVVFDLTKSDFSSFLSE